MRQDKTRNADEAGFVRKSARIDELDDVPLPLPLVTNRYCGALGCRRRARPGGRHCAVCHAAAVRSWRERNGRELAVQRRDAAALRDEKTRARDSARAKLATAIRRGHVDRGACVVCGSASVMALMADPRRPLEVVWTCRSDRQEAGRQHVEAAERRIAVVAQAEWINECARVLAAIELLQPEVRDSLLAVAARGPAGLRLSAEAPLFTMNLVRVYNATFARAPENQKSGDVLAAPECRHSLRGS